MSWLLGSDEELLARIASASASGSRSPKELGLEPGVLRDRLDHHPRTRHRVLQPVSNLHPPGALRVEPECPLCSADVGLGVGAGCLALLGGYVEDAYITSCSRVNGGDPAAQRPCAVDSHRTLIDIGGQSIRHGKLLSLLKRRLLNGPFARFLGAAHGQRPLPLWRPNHRADPSPALVTFSVRLCPGRRQRRTSHAAPVERPGNLGGSDP